MIELSFVSNDQPTRYLQHPDWVHILGSSQKENSKIDA